MYVYLYLYIHTFYLCAHSPRDVKGSKNHESNLNVSNIVACIAANFEIDCSTIIMLLLCLFYYLLCYYIYTIMSPSSTYVPDYLQSKEAFATAIQ